MSDLKQTILALLKDDDIRAAVGECIRDASIGQTTTSFVVPPGTKWHECYFVYANDIATCNMCGKTKPYIGAPEPPE